MGEEAHSYPLGAALRTLGVHPGHFALATNVLGERVPPDFVERMQGLLSPGRKATGTGEPLPDLALGMTVALVATYFQLLSGGNEVTPELRALAKHIVYDSLSIH